jgi:IS605 OrfB family transposase
VRVVLSHRIALVPTAGQERVVVPGGGSLPFCVQLGVGGVEAAVGGKRSRSAPSAQFHQAPTVPVDAAGSQVRAPASDQELRGGVSAILQQAGPLSEFQEEGRARFCTLGQRPRDMPEPVRESQAAVGVDLGLSTTATLASGEKLVGPKAQAAHLERLQRLSRWHSRKKKGSHNRRKSTMRLARLHARVSHVRRAWLHQTTTRLVREFSVTGIEDLNVRGMMANEKLARNIADIGFHEFRRQLEYKARLYGAEAVTASRWFPSSKKCSACGRLWEELPLSIREWTCECGTFHARDIKAARNLRRYALHRASCARINACGEEGSGAGLTPSVKPTSLESTMSYLGMD